jgi:hypothetical protein
VYASGVGHQLDGLVSLPALPQFGIFLVEPDELDQVLDAEVKSVNA